MKIKNIKYKLLPDSMYYDHTEVYRIQALKNFGNVKKGDIGGYVESEDCISQFDKCWVYDNSVILNPSHISFNAKVMDYSVIENGACITDNSTVSASTISRSNIRGLTNVRNHSSIIDSNIKHISAIDNSVIKHSDILNYCIKYSSIEYSSLTNCEIMFRRAQRHLSDITLNTAKITTKSDFVKIENIGSRIDTTCFYKRKDGDIGVTCGCFKGTIDEFESAVIKRHVNSKKYLNEYQAAIALAKNHFEIGS